MEGHRAAVLHGARQEKRALVRKMKEREDLGNPEGSAEEKVEEVRVERIRVEIPP